MDFGSTSTVTFVTVAFGASTTGIPARLPAVFVTLDATQHLLPELNGSVICHQPPSPDFPTIWELVPILKPLRTIHAVPGPRRQLTATSFGKATGTVGVEVVVAGGVFDGRIVCVGTSVERNSVADGVSATAVGVSVAVPDGRLQASIAKTSIRIGKKVRGFIISPLI